MTDNLHTSKWSTHSQNHQNSRKSNPDKDIPNHVPYTEWSLGYLKTVRQLLISNTRQSWPSFHLILNVRARHLFFSYFFLGFSPLANWIGQAAIFYSILFLSRLDNSPLMSLWTIVRSSVILLLPLFIIKKFFVCQHSFKLSRSHSLISFIFRKHNNQWIVDRYWQRSTCCWQSKIWGTKSSLGQKESILTCTVTAYWFTFMLNQFNIL